jgi:hypothetical protein
MDVCFRTPRGKQQLFGSLFGMVGGIAAMELP